MGSEFLLSDLAARIGARVVGGEVEDAVVSGVAPIEEAGPGQVTFLANRKLARFARDSNASGIIAREAVPGAHTAFLISDNPYLAFACVVEMFHPPARFTPGISDKAAVDPSAHLGKDVTVSPCVVIEEGAEVGDRTVLFPGVYVGKGVSIGSDCLAYPNVVMYHGVKVGSRVILHAGCVIGSDGFGFAPTPEGFRKIPQVGTVEIEDDVEIGANTTIDRATLGVTRVCRGAKLDNLIQVAHNVVIGGNTVIAAQAGISGSTRIGSRVMIGGQAGLAGHLEVEDGIMLGAKCGVPDSLRASDSRVWSGIPVMPHPTWLRLSALMPKVPELFRRVKRLEEGKNQKGET
ncbi:MAG: UDP-3-O-(3-hydroxymyristoyl)glucosamine N-acyltransferase [Deltaproteobacteria bacterium]|nr:MAG: UDP-3-O-(3-hydroxymyristoyl)glucosamine N-acyltransferase [Deltaproteobacteria bacterium]